MGLRAWWERVLLDQSRAAAPRQSPIEERRRPPARPRTVWVKHLAPGVYEPQCVCGWRGEVLAKLDDVTPAHVAALAHAQTCPAVRELMRMWENLVGVPCAVRFPGREARR